MKRAVRGALRVLVSALRALTWWVIVRARWRRLCRQARLAERGDASAPARARTTQRQANCPRLRRLRVTRHSLQLTVRARPGQTIAELEVGAERLASALNAHAFRCLAHPKNPGSTVVIELVVRDVLTAAATASPQEPRAEVDQVRLGRTQAGKDWHLQVRGRHTLCVGASGAGKGSVLWGVACGLAPAAHVNLARLWGIDLKRGVELSTGAELFARLAYTPEDAVEVLRELVEVINQRGAEMVGKTRLHEPQVDDPLHVLVIDELAALTAYAPMDVRREADKVLAVILTQGRALGVVVVAFVQDPRKEVVGSRSLFTQTVALRLRTITETEMVVGDGMGRLAPAHRINPTRPGTGWIVEDTGAVDRVRADFWPDDLIRTLSVRYAAPLPLPTVPDDVEGALS